MDTGDAERRCLERGGFSWKPPAEVRLSAGYGGKVRRWYCVDSTNGCCRRVPLPRWGLVGVTYLAATAHQSLQNVA
jgi:hypothetical protein